MNLTSVMNNKNEDLINRIVSLMERDDAADAPEETLRWAKNIFRARVAEPKKSIVQKVLAVLQADLSPNRAVFGERSASGAQARQMLFVAGENSVDLRIGASGKGFFIKGQILGSGLTEAEITLVGRDNSYTTRADELSEFNFVRVSAGSYQIILKSAKKEIVIENFEIG